MEPGLHLILVTKMTGMIEDEPRIQQLPLGWTAVAPQERLQ
jgi:hypothetical protein